MKETITLNSKEQKRLMVLSKVDRGELTATLAATLLGRSVRQVRRIRAAYRKEGAAGLAHGNRGRKPSHTVAPALRERVVTLAHTTYRGCNHQHLTELLAEREEILVSRASVRRWLLAAGLRSPRRRRPPKHRSRRERMPQEGMLLQMDGSPHAWLEGRGPRLTLVGAIDDATGTVPAAHFRLQEDGQGYLLVLLDILTTKGVPLAVYRDRHGIFQRSTQEPWTLQEELAGQRFPTQVERCFQELGIQSIPAHSPQAKGRIERLWQTFQDRLGAELRLAEAVTQDEAEAVLQDYLPRFNRQFGVPPAQPGSAYRPLPQGLDPQAVCCFKYQRTVAQDNTVTLGEHRLQLLPGPCRQSYARAQVEVQERLDGSLTVYYQGVCLATAPAPPTAPVLRARSVRRVSTALPLRNAEAERGTPPPRPLRTAAWTGKPPPDHPWRKPLTVARRTKSLNN